MKTIVLWIVQLVMYLIEHMSDSNQRKVVQDELVKDALDKLNRKKAIAEQIDADSSDLSDADVDNILRDLYREDKPTSDKH